jgi:hypothetical protein
MLLVNVDDIFVMVATIATVQTLQWTKVFAARSSKRFLTLAMVMHLGRAIAVRLDALTIV